MMIALVLLLGITIYLIVLFRFKPKSPRGRDRNRKMAMDILKKRHSSGDISSDEFEEIKHDIQ